MTQLVEAERHIEQRLQKAGFVRGQDYSGLTVDFVEPQAHFLDAANLKVTIPSMKKECEAEGRFPTITLIMMEETRGTPRSVFPCGALETLPTGELGPYVVEVWTFSLPTGWRGEEKKDGE